MIVFPIEEPALTDLSPVLESEKLKDGGGVDFCRARAGDSRLNDPINSVKRLEEAVKIVNVQTCGNLLLAIAAVVMIFYSLP